jgi:cytidine deaminase
MLQHGESSIRMIVAATADGEILPPCGRCREMLFQVDGANLEIMVVMPGLELVTLRDLLPYNWQDFTAAVATPVGGGGAGQR